MKNGDIRTSAKRGGNSLPAGNFRYSKDTGFGPRLLRTSLGGERDHGVPTQGVSGHLLARKVTVIVGVFPSKQRLFVHAQVSQKVYLKAQKMLIP